MALKKCCVDGCDSTNVTHRLFCMPKNNNFRNLWMSMLVPTSPYLLGLSTDQLARKRVCQKHFDETQFDQRGVRIRYSYPCLFTEKEFLHGVPLSSEQYNVLNEHNYCSQENPQDNLELGEPAVLMGMPVDVLAEEHLYALPSTSEVVSSAKPKNDVDVLAEEHLYALPSTSEVVSSAKPKNYVDVLAEEHSYALPSTSEVVSSAKPNNDGVLEEPQASYSAISEPATTTASLQIQNKEVSVPRRPLIDITLKENIHVELIQTIQPSTSNEVSLRLPLMDITEKENFQTEHIQVPQPSSSMGISVSRSPALARSETKTVQTTKQPTSEGIAGIKQFKSKTRRFIRETTNIATSSLGQTSTERLENAKTYAENKELIENFSNLNRKAKAFLLMQLRLARKNKMARRFSLEDKLFALTLMKQSPKGYKLLENIFALPTKRTLARLSKRIVFECGINETTFDHIKNTTKNWDVKKKLCTVAFDEVALTPNLTYNESKDKINGFVEIAGERRQKFADHALVFMIRGICSSWRQSIAYYFCAGTVSALELEKILEEIIVKLVEAGLDPLALVCDQGSTFRSYFKKLKAAAARPDDTVNVAGKELFIFHDPPHLLKGIRNNFLEKDILFQGRRATWDDILYVFDVDLQCGHTRNLPKLTADHVDPKKMKKMRVKVAAQVLSARTSAMLKYTQVMHQRLGHRRDTMDATADVVLFFDELFDSVNGSPGQPKGKLRCAVKKDSVHMDFWRSCINKLKNLQFVDIKSKLAKRAGKPRYVRVPSLDGWIMTLNSFLGLANVLFSRYNVDYFYPRLINQDPLENFFGRIRAANNRNINPDANAFIYTFKSLVITNILSPQSKFANCEDDVGETLIDLNYLFTPPQIKENISYGPVNINTSSSSSLPSHSHGGTALESVSEVIKVHASAYTAGYICRKISKKIKCNKCARTYVTTQIQGIHLYITHREYKRLKGNNHLTYPTGRVILLYRESAQLIHNYLNNYCHENNIKKKLSSIIGKRLKISWLGCSEHSQMVQKYFKELIIRLHVHNWCNIVNKILNGKIHEKYVSKMHNLHMAALKKYKSHRLKQKCTKNM